MMFFDVAQSIGYGLVAVLIGYAARLHLVAYLEHFVRKGSVFSSDDSINCLLKTWIVYACVSSLALLLTVLPALGGVFGQEPAHSKIVLALIVGCLLRLGAALFEDRTATLVSAWIPSALSVLAYLWLRNPTLVSNSILSTAGDEVKVQYVTVAFGLGLLVFPIAVEVWAWAITRGRSPAQAGT